MKIKDTLSDKVTISYGVPQGSVLEPVYFTSYTTPPLSAIISSIDIIITIFLPRILKSLSA